MDLCVTNVSYNNTLKTSVGRRYFKYLIAIVSSGAWFSSKLSCLAYTTTFFLTDLLMALMSHGITSFRLAP